MVAGAAVGQDGHPAAGRDHLPRQAPKTSILDVVALVPSIRLSKPTATIAVSPGHGFGVTRLSASVASPSPSRSRSEVHGDDDVAARSHQMRHPAGEALPDIDATVAEQTIDLLDRVLCATLCRVLALKSGLANHRDGQRRAGHDAQCGRRESDPTRLACRSWAHRLSMNARMSFSRPPPRSSDDLMSMTQTNPRNSPIW